MSLRRVGPDEAHGLMVQEGYRYLDVRSTTEFALGHPAGAFNIPWQHQVDGSMRDNPDFMRAVRRCFAQADKLIIGCRTGHRSLLAAQRLIDAGFAAVVELEGGFAGTKDPFGRVSAPGWQQAGLPVALDAQPGRSYAELTGGDD